MSANERITEAQYLAAHEQGFKDGFASVQAELQAAQEREEAISQLIRKPNGVIPSQWYWELPAKIDQVLAAQRSEEPSEKGACPSCGLNFGHEAGCPEESSDDEGLEPIETSPLTEREPDL